ncbi:MAG: hypothetical protein V1903_11050 [Bacteroidota bacterium]
MKEERLKDLLDKYYKGETSEAEERELKIYLSGSYILKGYDAERDIFSHYPLHDAILEPSSGFSERIMKAVDELERLEKSKLVRKRYISILSSAAAILLFMGSYYIFFGHKPTEDTFTDPQLAYAETMRILNEVSVKLNKGTEALRPISKVQHISTGLNAVGESADKISSNLRRIKILDGISDNNK